MVIEVADEVVVGVVLVWRVGREGHWSWRI